MAEQITGKAPHDRQLAPLSPSVQWLPAVRIRQAAELHWNSGLCSGIGL